MDLGTWGNIATIGSFTLSILAVAGFALRWAVKHYLSELKPNHGSSLRDAVSDIHEDLSKLSECVTEISLSLAKLSGRFEQHIEENNK